MTYDLGFMIWGFRIMKPQFKVLSAEKQGQRAYVVAQPLNPMRFAVSKGSILGRCRLKSELQELSPGTFTFRLESAEDVSHFTSGDVLDLTT